jgi:hypothetical protein
MCHEVIPRIEMGGLLIVVVIADDFPVSAAGQDGTVEKWAFESPAFEDYGGAVAVGAGSDVTETFHVTFEMKEKLERWNWKGEVWFRPF